MIEVRLLAGVEVRRDGTPVALQPKRLLLLAYLLLEGRARAVRRDELVALFWPEADMDRGRNALRQALFALRGALGAPVIVARGSAELTVDAAMVACDAWALLDAVDAGDHAAVERLYARELLATVGGAPDVPELERWLEDARARFRRLATMAVRTLAEATATPGAATAERRRLLERWLALAPYDETAIATLVTVLLAAGDRTAAVDAYRRYVARLRADLELAPSEALEELVREVRTRSAAGVSVAAPGETAVAAARPRGPWQRRRWALVVGAMTLLLAVSVPRRPDPDAALVRVEAFTGAGGADGQRLAATAAARLRGALAGVAGATVLDGPAAPRSGWRDRRQAPGTVVRGGVEALAGGAGAPGPRCRPTSRPRCCSAPSSRASRRTRCSPRWPTA
jgi:serine/threonine-protein kinase